MIVTEVLYVALATIAVMVVLQLATFLITRMMYPPEPKVVYVQQPPRIQEAPQVPVQQLMTQHMIPSVAPPPSQQNGPAFTQQQEVKLPEYEPRKPASDSLRVDPELPIGLQETRPEGL